MWRTLYTSQKFALQGQINKLPVKTSMVSMMTSMYPRSLEPHLIANFLIYESFKYCRSTLCRKVWIAQRNKRHTYIYCLCDELSLCSDFLSYNINVFCILNMLAPQLAMAQQDLFTDASLYWRPPLYICGMIPESLIWEYNQKKCYFFISCIHLYIWNLSLNL